MSRYCALGWLLAVLVSGGTASVAADDSTTKPRIEIGFDGAYKVGRWTPAHVHGPADAKAEAFLAAVDPDGRRVEFPLAKQPDGSFAGLFLSGRLDSPIEVTVTTDGNVRKHRLQTGSGEPLRSFRQSTQFWLIVGEAQAGFVTAAQQLNDEASKVGRGQVVELLRWNVAQLPERAAALSSLDTIVLNSLTLTEGQSAALQEWVTAGGRLILLIGTADEATAQLPVTKWLPVTVAPSVVERQTAVLTNRITAFVPDSPPLRTLENLTVSPLTIRDGISMVDSPEGTIVSRSAVGLGMVTIVALDIRRPPFVDPSNSSTAVASNETADGSSGGTLLWTGLPGFCRKLAGEPTAAVDAITSQSQLAPTGVSDMQTQLATMLDHFPEVQRPSNWNVIGLIVIYLLIVGPVDYLLVHRILKQPHWTWGTLPIWILLGAWWSTSYAAEANGVTVETNQLHVVDIAADTGTRRTLGWFSLYSPETRRHTISVSTSEIGSPQSATDATTVDKDSRTGVRISWLPRPEEAFRGMYRRGGIDLGSAGYRLGENIGEAEQIPFAIWSSQAIASEIQDVVSPETPIAECRQVHDRFGRVLSWELTHHLPGVLEDWFAVEGVQVKFPLPGQAEAASLAPGQPRDLTRDIGQQLLRSYIQGESATSRKTKHGEQIYVRSEAYDPLSVDPERFLRTLTFCEAIGGEGYTRLTNQTLDRLDYSEFIHLNRLVVFGRLKSTATEFHVDGQPVPAREPVTYVRLIVPIQRELLGTSLP